jgi:hypothetical protein
LLLADPLQQQGIAALLQADPSLGQVIFRPGELDGAPQLVIWSLASAPPAASLELELQRLHERWQPVPILLLLPGGHGYPALYLMQLPLQGLLEAPTAGALRDAVTTLLAGGRVLEIAPAAETPGNGSGLPPALGAMGLGQWLLTTGLWQIEAELRLCAQGLDQPPPSLLGLLLLQGRVRELRAARQVYPSARARPQTRYCPVAPKTHPHPRPPTQTPRLSAKKTIKAWPSPPRASRARRRSRMQRA